MKLWDFDENEEWNSPRREELHAMPVVNAEGDIVSYADFREIRDFIE